MITTKLPAVLHRLRDIAFEFLAITCRITLNHLSTAAMRLMSNYFHHLLFLDAHIDSRTDSQALRAEYCIVFIQQNTAI